MCGIVGFTGRREASPILLEGLRRLEYRGYDSAGLDHRHGQRTAPPQEGRAARRTRPSTSAAAPRPRVLRHQPHALGHARRRHRPQRPPAPRRQRQHRRRPQRRHRELRHASSSNSRPTGVQFRSRHRHRGPRPPDRATTTRATSLAAVRQALALVKGTYGLAVMSSTNPGVIVGARLGSPLVVGIGEDGHYLASPTPTPSAGYADKVVYLNDRQICAARPRATGRSATRTSTRVGVRSSDIAHFLGDGDAEQGRLPALHAQGDLRAARGARERHARPARRRRRHRPLRRPEPRRRSSCGRSTASS